MMMMMIIIIIITIITIIIVIVDRFSDYSFLTGWETFSPFSYSFSLIVYHSQKMDNKLSQVSNYSTYSSMYFYTISANNHKLKDFIMYPTDLKKIVSWN